MNYFDKLAELGFMLVIRRNQLGTHTLFAVRPSEVTTLDDLPEWRIVDFTTDELAPEAAQRLYEKLTLTGRYVDWDDKMTRYGLTDELIGFAHRPPEDIFEVANEDLA